MPKRREIIYSTLYLNVKSKSRAYLRLSSQNFCTVFHFHHFVTYIVIFSEVFLRLDENFARFKLKKFKRKLIQINISLVEADLTCSPSFKESFPVGTKINFVQEGRAVGEE